MATEGERFAKFTQELEKLSVKYGVVVRSTGGVLVGRDGDRLLAVKYSKDWTSGDLDVQMKWDSPLEMVQDLLDKIVSEARVQKKPSQFLRGVKDAVISCETVLSGDTPDIKTDIRLFAEDELRALTRREQSLSPFDEGRVFVFRNLISKLFRAQTR